MHKVEVKIAKIAKIHAAAAIAGGHPMRACDLFIEAGCGAHSGSLHTPPILTIFKSPAIMTMMRNIYENHDRSACIECDRLSTRAPSY